MLSSSKLKSMPSGTRWCLNQLRTHLATTSICVLLVTLMIFNPTSAASSSPKTTNAANINQTSSTTSQTSGQTSSSSLASSADKSGDSKSPDNSKTNGANSAASGQQQISNVEQQQLEPTDLSSMYVQIPIAEPVDTGMNEGSQQQIVSGDSDSAGAGPADTKASTWTGPWPKKFQIGYIKQSDLHQVLIESLKGDPFAHLTNPSTAGGKSASSTSAGALSSPSSASSAPTKTGGVKTGGGLPSDSSALMAPQNQWPPNAGAIYGRIQRQHPQAQHMQLMAKSIYHNQHQPMSAHNFREPKFMQPPQIPQVQQVNRYHQSRPFVNQQPTMLQNSMQNVFQQQQQQLLQQQQHQYQLTAGGFPTSFKNQPVYTINNHLHQEQLDANSMQLLMPPQAQLGGQTRPQKSSDYYGSSWRPVSSDKSEPPSLPATKGAQSSLGQQQQQQQLQYQSDYQALNDGFDDGFNSPSKDSGPATTDSMNRHPMLNNYLATNSGKLSPAMVAKSSPASSSSGAPTSSVKGQQQTKSAAAATSTTTSDSGSTKSAQPPTAKGGGESSMSSPANRRRSQSGSSTPSSVTSSTTASSNDTQSSTAVPSGDESPSPTTSSSADRSSTTTTTMSTTTTSSSADSETTEPDSEVIDSETTEPSTGDGTTTTTTGPQQESTTGAASAAAAAGAASTSASPSMDSAGGNSQQAGGGDSEVATQGMGQPASGTASLPSLTGADGNDAALGSTQRTSTPSTGGNFREETTPTAGETKGEVEGDNKRTTIMASTMSDEALLDAVVRTGADIAKSAKGTTPMSELQQSQQRSASITSTTTAASTGGSKRARSSERLVQSAAGAKSSAGRNKPANKLITKKPAAVASSAKSTKQATDGGVKGGSSPKVLSAQSARTGKSSSTRRSAAAAAAKSSANKKPATVKATRMASAELLQRQQQQQQQPQLVTMTAAQAQSTAQTLASILLSRCLLSTNCAHLLDVCSTKQAAVPLVQQDNPDSPPTGNALVGSSASSAGMSAALVSSNSTTSAAWSVPIGLMSSSIMSIAQALQADRVLSQFPQWREAIEGIVDQEAQTGYTLLLPSNEAIERQAAASVESWLANPELLGQIIDNHVVDSAETIEFGGARAQTRFIRGKGLQVNQHRDKMVTINGKRVVYANQAAPAGGRIHVIDGVLDWPAGSQANLLDIMDTLKQCDKFDGFVTLAQGTGLTQVLKQDGPLTVFVPSNDALRRIPDDELEVIKNNSTALKEFLMYHVVNGSYFSQDLRDGQQLASILDMKPIQVGVRVDGCSRRLVEANTSPMWRPDIAAKNGVIHILDWYLSTKNNECFNQMNRPTPSSRTTPSSIATSSSTQAASERLQQLASESGIGGYATRVALPANHKPAAPTPSVTIEPAADGEQQQQSTLATTSGAQKGAQSNSESALGVSASSDASNISVSAIPLAAA